MNLRVYRGILGRGPGLRPELDQTQFLPVGLEHRAGAVLRLEAGDAVIAQGIADCHVDGDK